MENPRVADYWMRQSTGISVLPKFRNIEYLFNCMGDVDDQFCILYLVYQEREFCYIVSQSRLEDPSRAPPSHIQAMELFTDHDTRKFVNPYHSRDFPTKYDFIIGAFYNRGRKEFRSCANYIYVGQREAKDDLIPKMEATVMKYIEENCVRIQ